MDSTSFEQLYKKIQEKQASPEEIKAFFEAVAQLRNEAELEAILPHDEWQELQGDESLQPQLEKHILQSIHTGRRKQPKSIKRRLQPLMKYAAIILLAISGFWIYRYASQPEQAFVTAFSGTGEIKKIVLPDSSIATLNAESSLKYPETFADSRDVYLKGEAFFEVNTNADHPFIVHSDKIQTQVLGTSFNVKSYDEEDPTVTVLSGKVKVADNQNTAKSAVLTQGDRLVYALNDGRLNVSNDSLNLAADSWRKGMINMDNLSLAQVAAILERWYDVKIELASPGIAAKVFAGTGGRIRMLL
ncbi:hypothetical protein COR50_07150 [Chitinophaga caeni]|uniref:Uncharacterized protein n=1 Tax=Chitinophaga caeni TaxID=2029983 RepID=A0A291QSI7_9BACT|nr:FecR domain-containing protein [Chitinophaga caeni]ATL46979.1 hypothetical protein COR50_07150 [Chitinophaga caeni]